MKLNVKFFSELTNEQLYRILKLRYDIFVLEQKSIYDEYDGKDYDAVHIFLQEKKEVLAYLRIYKKSNKVASIGRVVVDQRFRKQGLGRKLMNEGINYIKSNWKTDRLEIGAQEYLKKFYESFGFKPTSQPYDDCGVSHIDMEMKL